MTTREEVVAEARRWIGTPYRHQGRIRGLAVDCVGLLIGVARTCEIVESGFDIKGYSRAPDGKTILLLSDAHMVPIPISTIQLGDVAVFKWHRFAQHLGILANYLHGGLSLIHAFGTPDGRGAVIEQRLDASMRRRLVAAYSFPGIQ